MQAPLKPHPNAQLYINLMTELKERIAVVQQTGSLVGKKQYYAGVQFGAEFCMLQLRFCCELLAVGSIVIHTDIPQAMKLKKEWNAQRIMDNFDKLKADHFPTPVLDHPKPELGYTHIAAHHDGCLTKKEMLKMYHFFGEHLHAGSYEKFVKPQQRRHSFKILNDFTTQMMKLLNTHTYVLFEKERLVRIVMQTLPDGHVAWNEFEKRDDLTAAANVRRQHSK
jgi:hypothetical protein